MHSLAHFGSLRSAWIFIATASLCVVLTACDDDEANNDSHGGDEDAGHTSRTDSGMDGGGRDAGDGGSHVAWVEPGFRVYLEGSSIVLATRAGAKLSYLTCQDAIVVEKREGDAWVPMRDDQPPYGQNPGYYIDGRYVPQSFNLGCDAVGCIRFQEKTVVARAEEYVKTGTKAPPEGEVSRDPEVAVIETRPFEGQLRVRVHYFRGAMCGDMDELSLELNVPHGVCCPIGSTGCSSEGPGGGWAPSLDACPEWSIVFDAYFERGTDAHDCPVLVEDESVCCGCVNPSDAGN